jgi:nucleotidyltransferase substrate binding protein (TIGR01987 family)
MERINEKIVDYLDALKTLEKILKKFFEYKSMYAAHPTVENEENFLMARDATIQRFEYCTDLIWKVIKIYLEEIEKANIEAFFPLGIIRSAVTGRFLSESEGEELIEMVKSRNKTSHIYHEAIADDIANKIPGYYVLMKKIIDRIQASIAKE